MEFEAPHVQAHKTCLESALEFGNPAVSMSVGSLLMLCLLGVQQCSVDLSLSNRRLSADAHHWDELYLSYRPLQRVNDEQPGVGWRQALIILIEVSPVVAQSRLTTSNAFVWTEAS